MSLKFEHIPLPDIFPKLIMDYLAGNKQVTEFYQYERDLGQFPQIIEDITPRKINREVLVEALTRQYEGVDTPAQVSKNIKLLAESNAYTITTAHQPCLFTGPLYFIYKIQSVINLAAKAKEAYPKEHFIPIYMMGAEDHDFEEINHAFLFSKKLEWKQNGGGAVGKLSTDSMQEVLAELQELLGQEAPDLNEMLKKSYEKGHNLETATRILVNELFGDQGLVILSGDDAQLKGQFKNIIGQEITKRKSESLVNTAIQRLEEKGYHGQANPREINMFYLGEGFRERIVWNNKGKTVEVLNTKLSFKADEIASEIEQNPQNFSTNVILRGLYQQSILPNLVYVGGPGELSYWMELKQVFAHYDIQYPMLLLRDSVLWLNKNQAQQMQQLGFSPADLFKDKDALIAEFVARESEDSISLEEEKNQLQAISKAIAEKATAVDKSLTGSVEAFAQKQQNAVENLEAKLRKAQKARFNTQTEQIQKLKEKLFPDRGMQERRDNFMPIYLKHGKEFIEILRTALDPTSTDLTVVIES